MSTNESLYLGSIILHAKQYAHGIRAHWGIENSLHYLKDVTFKEDGSKINSGNAPEIMSLVTNLVINVFRINFETTIKKAIRQNAGKIKQQAQLILE
ncbi:MAG: transposase [Bacteroidetes bacterium]|nr:transposase [Bacteroidota bacterium]